MAAAMAAEAPMYMTMATIHMLIGAILIFALILVIGNENRVIGHDQVEDTIRAFC